MKPDNAIQLPTDYDLAEASLELALEIITKELKNPQEMRYGWITIPSQSVSEAVLLTRHSDFLRLSYPNIHLSLEISCQYDVDEWSVTVNNWNFDGEKSFNDPIIVWSNGA